MTGLKSLTLNRDQNRKLTKVKWNDIKYSDPNPKKWVLDSAYPSDKTSQKALKCFKDENPEKRLLLEQISLNGQTEKSSVLSQKQPEKKRKRLLSSDEDDFALDTIAPKVRKENSEKSINKKSSKKSSEDEKENRPKESTEKSSDVVRKEPTIPPKSKEVQNEKEPETEVIAVKEPEIIKVPVKIGHAIDPKINSVVQVDIGEAPKRTGPCVEYSQTVGHRIIQLSEHSIDVQIRVQGRFKITRNLSLLFISYES